MILDCKGCFRLLFAILLITIIGSYFLTVDLLRSEVDAHVAYLLERFFAFDLLLLADPLHECSWLDSGIHFAKQ